MVHGRTAMTLNDDLDSLPMPPIVRSVLLEAHVVTIAAGQEICFLADAVGTLSAADDSFWISGPAYRNLKAIGDMAERLRGVSTWLRRNLTADHFEGRKRVGIEAIVLEGIKAYAGRVPGLLGEVLYIP